MTLRRRIAAVVAAGVAGVVLALAAIGYLSIRSHMLDQVDQALTARGAPYTQERVGPPRPTRVRVPPPEPFGGASGYFQFVRANGTAFTGNGPALLHYGPRALAIARTGKGSYFTDETVLGTHLRVLTVADPDASLAVQIARPLNEIDAVLHQVLITYAVVILVGVVLAALFGGLIGRSAIAPIVRFTRRSENITGALDRSQRLEEEGAEELVALATSFNRMLDTLERSVQAQKNLVADASHELRTPIAALRSNIQIFLEGHRLPASERVELQAAILAELDQLTQLVTDVVELARGHPHQEEVEVLRLDAVVTEAVGRSRRRAPTLTFDVTLEPTLIEHDIDQIERAVGNLVDNACAWSPSSGTIVIGLEAGTLSVRDHGPGFNDRDLPHIFDRFYRADHARRRPGSGLGLAIVRQAAEARGGYAEALNAPGGGAMLRVSFGAVLNQPTPIASALED
jgi:two-component system sensor histidine kinase MprB